MLEGAREHSKDRNLAKTRVNGATVSTVFLGLDHRFGAGPPLVFETMVFGGELDGDCDRYSTYDEAELGHVNMVNKVAAVKNKVGIESQNHITQQAIKVPASPSA